MKNLIYLLVALFILSSCDETIVPDPPIDLSDSISMGAGYANDIYYSLENGIVKTTPRAGWDIAFSTSPMSSTVMINEGYGVELYAYPLGGLDAWDAIDTTGMAGWTKLYNVDTTWVDDGAGAFDRNTTGHPDYGWGVYNSQNHDVVGDSLFIIKLSDGSLQKILIVKRAAMSNSYFVKYGDIDSEGIVKEIHCGPVQSKNFIYFSLETGEVLDNEPDSESWDIVFTKYHDESIPYIVTGVLSNVNVESAEVRNMDTGLADPSTATFSEDISVIGSDWKSFDMGTYTYQVEPDLCYFVRRDGLTYKIVFTGTDGSVSGKIVFDIEKLD
jgi:hypothetical protein